MSVETKPLTRTNQEKTFRVLISFSVVFLGIIVLSKPTIASAEARQIAGTNVRSREAAGISNINQTSRVQVQMGAISQNIYPDQVLQPVKPDIKKIINTDVSSARELFTDLHFPDYLLSYGKIQISDHESMTFLDHKVEIEAFGNEVKLDLKTQELISMTFAGFVLGPFYPDHDYLGTYFQTMQDIKLMMKKKSEDLKNGPEKDARLLSALSQSSVIMDGFIKRSQQVVRNSERRYEQNKVKNAVREYYEGEMPDHIAFKAFKRNASNGEYDWEAVMTLESHQDEGKIQNRMFRFRERGEGLETVSIQDRDYKNQVFIEERFDYAGPGDLQAHSVETYYENNVLKSKAETTFNGGVKAKRYVEQFDQSGRKTRFLNQNFYLDGSLKIVSDYQYNVGKRYFKKLGPNGNIVSSAVKDIQIQPA